MARILVVDDIFFMRSLIKRIIIEGGHEFAGDADNGIDALNRFKSLKPDIVITDIIMPSSKSTGPEDSKEKRKAGLDVIKNIINIDRKARIIVCSTLDEKDIILQALQDGAKSYIIKPFQPNELLKMIDQVISTPEENIVIEPVTTKTITLKETHKQAKKLKENHIVTTFLESCPEIAILLNSSRRLLLANDKMLNLLEPGRDNLIGLTIGDIFQCIHYNETLGGCSTTKACRYCGACNAISASLKNMQQVSLEWKLSVKSSSTYVNAFNFFVWATPVKIEEELHIILTLRDISSEKYRQILERIFFQNILSNIDDIPEMDSPGLYITKEVLLEIYSQRVLMEAERKKLTLRPEDLNIPDFFSLFCSFYKHHPISYGIGIIPPEIPEGLKVLTDRILLTRVLGNLMKNALEASSMGQTVKVMFEMEEKYAVFSIHNQSHIPEDVKINIFTRFFTTKIKRGYGVGTYTAKLLTEKYLNGKISFNSTIEDGTTFTVRIPIA